MKTKRIFSLCAAAAMLLPAALSLGGCTRDKEITLRIYNWEEYIDEGGEGAYDYDNPPEEGEADTRPILEKFEEWYEKEYGKSVRVEYSTFGTNEDLYNQLKLGDKYDLVCPSEYMIMKLAAENMLEPLETDKLGVYNENVSGYIKDVFDATYAVGKEPLGNYAAGYMWGVTGLVYNPQLVDEADFSKGWAVMLDSKYKNKVTTKDNVRDSYFVGLGIHNREKLLQLKADNESGKLSDKEYNAQLTQIMNDVEPETVKQVKQILLDMKSNIFGFETDTGKSDMVKGTISMNFAWSGDAVYAMDEAEKQDVLLNFFVPDEGANLFFDGWVMPKEDKRDEETKQAAYAFINFMSMPQNAVRNSYYIGYTSVIAGDEMLEYMQDTYGEDEGEDYDLSYFFGSDAVIKTTEENRQLFAQYPPSSVVNRCAVMKYYGEAEEEINELWTQVKGESLSAWAIVVLCVAAVAVVLFVVFTKFGSKIEFRPKPKKGYTLVKQEKLK